MKNTLACALATLSLGAAGQDVVFTINPIGGTVEAEYFGDLVLQQMWSSISVRISGDGPLHITSENPVYTNLLSPTGAIIAGEGTNNLTFVGEAVGDHLGGPIDSRNPFSPFTFSYAGSLSAFDFELFSQNTVTFVQPPFGNAVNLINGSNPGTISFRIDIVPAPATTALLGIGGIGMMRRRR